MDKLRNKLNIITLTVEHTEFDAIVTGIVVCPGGVHFCAVCAAVIVEVPLPGDGVAGGVIGKVHGQRMLSAAGVHIEIRNQRSCSPVERNGSHIHNAAIGIMRTCGITCIDAGAVHIQGEVTQDRIEKHRIAVDVACAGLNSLK